MMSSTTIDTAVYGEMSNPHDNQLVGPTHDPVLSHEEKNWESTGQGTTALGIWFPFASPHWQVRVGMQFEVTF